MTRVQYLTQAAGITRDAVPGLHWLRIAVLSTFTVDFIKPCLVVEGGRDGLGFEVSIGPYGQIQQQALDPDSELYRGSPDVIFLLLRIEDLAPDLAFRFLAIDPAVRKSLEKELLDDLRRSIAAIRECSGATILLGNFPPVISPVAGIADGDLPDSQALLVQRLNVGLAELANEVGDVLILDLARIAAETGLSQWQDDRMNWIAKAPLGSSAMAAVAKGAARRLRPRFFPRAKCLVLDLDDTIWGGILGEAGADGIQLGPDYPGNVFLDFQRRILALRDRGILLAAASKNNASDVESVLRSHPACLIKRDHFSAFEVHWEDKATSLRRIAGNLNLGLDSLVFFDDNPVERAWVRDQVPEVAVIEVPPHPHDYVRALDECGFFDPLRLTEEDRQRTEFYLHESRRKEFRNDAGSLEEFLRGLSMRLSSGPVDAATLSRVAQLLARTNQFNLTTRRHSPANIQALLEHGGIGLWVRIQDRFGDCGLVAAALARPVEASVWTIDSLVMSCRVIGRKVETAVLALIENEIRSRGGQVVLGEFLPTAKNHPAANFYRDHGFSQVDDEGQQWSLTLDGSRAIPDLFSLD